VPNPAVRTQLDGPVPLTTLRELTGVCRTLYVDWTCNDADPLDLEELAQIGLELAHALSEARSTAPNSGAHRSAWARAEAATLRLGVLVARTERGEASARRPAALTSSVELPG
jgi:hypothetical protein